VDGRRSEDATDGNVAVRRVDVKLVDPMGRVERAPAMRE